MFVQRIVSTSPETWTAIFTAGLFAVTAALFFATYKLFKVASKESEGAKEALRISRVSAEAAKVSSEALLSSERPYVKEVIINTNFKEAYDIGQYDNSPTMPTHQASLHLWIKFKNYGRTPAEIIEYCFCLNIGQGQPPLRTRVDGGDYFISDFNLQEPTLAANGETPIFQQSFKENISWQLSREITCKHKTIWISGWVKWLDVFGNTTFRYFTWKYDRQLLIPCIPVFEIPPEQGQPAR